MESTKVNVFPKHTTGDNITDAVPSGQVVLMKKLRDNKNPTKHDSYMYLLKPHRYSTHDRVGLLYTAGLYFLDSAGNAVFNNIVEYEFDPVMWSSEAEIFDHFFNELNEVSTPEFPVRKRTPEPGDYVELFHINPAVREKVIGKYLGAIKRNGTVTHCAVNINNPEEYLTFENHTGRRRDLVMMKYMDCGVPNYPGEITPEMGIQTNYFKITNITTQYAWLNQQMAALAVL